MDKAFIIEHRMKLAAEYESSDRYLHALQIYNSILEENPSYWEAVIKTAEMYRKTGNEAAVIKLMDSYLAENSDNRELRFYYGEFLLNNNRWEDAIEVLSHFTPEENPVVSFFTGYAHFMLKEYEIARISFKNYTLLGEPGELKCEAYFFMAKIEIELNNFEQALSNLRQAESALNNFWEYNYLSALAYYNLGMHAHSVTLIERSISLNSREALNYNLAGRIYLKLGDYPNAEKHLRKYIVIKENVQADTYAFLAEACFHNKKTEEAMELFDKALAADPNNKIAADGKKNAADQMKRNKVSDG
jgi:tetratricopeptide (TPR) repeat protein